MHAQLFFWYGKIFRDTKQAHKLDEIKKMDEIMHEILKVRGRKVSAKKAEVKLILTNFMEFYLNFKREINFPLLFFKQTLKV